MNRPPQHLLGTALRVLWETGHGGDGQGAHLVAERVEGFSREECLEAGRLAKELDNVAYELAGIGWHTAAGRGSMDEATEQLEARCPGFAPEIYTEAIRKNITWARR